LRKSSLLPELRAVRQAITAVFGDCSEVRAVAK
jgi:hypothetical protein